MPLIGEKPVLLERVDPFQWHARPVGVLPPFQRVEVAEMHDPRHIGKCSANCATLQL